MARNGVSASGRNGRRSQGVYQAAHDQAVRLIEELESRLLLSNSHVHHHHHVQGPIATPTFVLFHGTRTAFSAGARPNAAAGPSGIAPATMQKAYGIDLVSFGSVIGDGTGQTIAIVDAYNAPSIQTDLAAFDTQFGLAAANLTVINQSGGTTLPANAPGAGNSWAVETSLDVEWAHSIAPGAKILLVEANSASDANLFAAVNTARNYAGVSSVSMSWGGDEYSGDTSFDQYLTTPGNHNGVTFLASSGDDGAYSPGTATLAVEYPAVSVNVLAIGGTSLHTSGGAYSSESAWGNSTSSGTSGGGGGGISKFASQPSYQNGVVTQTTTKRAVPDVSFDADPNTGVPVYDSYDISGTHWIQVGGTSLAAPMWAGVIAIADQGRALSGQGTLDGRTETLPKIYAAPSADFHDITSGDNGFAAGAGYDLATGRGTPIVNKLVQDLVGVVTPVPVIGSLGASPSAVESGSTITLTASNVVEANGTISSVKFYRESNGTSGLQTASDTLVGTGARNGTTWTINASTTGLGAGAYTYYAVATDASSVSSAAASASATVVSPTIGAFVASPSSVQAGASVTLTASNVAETNGAIGSVKFYRESNATSGLQTGADTLIGTGVQNGTTWSISTTAPLSGGSYTYYAVATDTANISSAASSANLTVVTPTIGSFAVSPSTTTAGTPVTLTASNVVETNGTVSSVVFYRESNSTSGLQTASDTLIGTGTRNGTTWAITAQTTGLANGSYTYYAVATDSVGLASSASSATLTIGSVVSGPVNNTFGNATVISGNPIAVTGSNVGANKESGEPTITTNAGGKSVWWNWTAPAGGKVTLNTKGSGFDTLLGVFTGNTVSTLTKIASNDDDAAGGTLTSALTFTAVQNTTYHIAVDGYNAASGNITLNLSQAVALPNDAFANATVITGNTATVTSTNVGATKESGEPSHTSNAGGTSVWFAWTAATTRLVSLNTHASSFDTLLAVYTGSSVSTLTKLASNDDDAAGSTRTSALSFNAVVGTTYYFAVDGYNGATGSITLNVA